MRILVTGTAGFIGFHLAKTLLDQGQTIVGLDSMNDYYCVDLKRKRHEMLKDYTSFTPLEIDICDIVSLQNTFEKYEPEIVCNLAGQAGVRYSLENPFAYQKSNLEGFLNVLELSKRYGVKRFVYASSSSVYGGLKELPFSESQRVDNPLSLYAATKKSNELTAHVYSSLFGMQTVGLRFFTVYGPWGRPDMALWLFTHAITNCKPITVFNYGDHKRDFTYIDDIVTGVMGALFANNLPNYSIFNLGNNKSESLMEMISLLEKNLGKTAEKNMVGMQSGDVKETYADIRLASEKLGFIPKISMKEGIPKFVEWYMNNKELAEIVSLSR